MMRLHVVKSIPEYLEKVIKSKDKANMIFKIVSLRDKGLSLRAIGTIVQCSHQTVKNKLDQYQVLKNLGILKN